jgi:sortase (surface protein transpeptidase)
MPRKGSRFFTNLFSPFMVCFLLAISALGIVSNTIAANLNLETESAKVAVLAAESKPKKTEAKKTAQEKPKAEPEQAVAPAAAAQPSNPQPAPAPQPQGCQAARPFIYVAAVGMCMGIIPVGMDGGAVGTPSNLYQAGWFNQSAYPGGSGSSFIDGHSPGAFSAIKGVGYGTIITIGLPDGQDVNYQVTGIENTPLGQVDMGRILSSPGLNLMTCSGSPMGNTYSHRFIVYSTRV